jgi:hypothetical protein
MPLLLTLAILTVVQLTRPVPASAGHAQVAGRVAIPDRPAVFLFRGGNDARNVPIDVRQDPDGVRRMTPHRSVL